MTTLKKEYTMRIKFEPLSKEALFSDCPPTPAIQHIPKWYKDINAHFTDDKRDRIFDGMGGTATNTTVKACIPFLDAMSLGYMVSLASDLEFSKDDNGELMIRWRNPYIKYIQDHDPRVAQGIPVKYGARSEILKWICDWSIFTPKGYSCLYTHPFNRHDLPFRTFTGIVDTDIYPDSVHFPFQLLNFSEDLFVLPAGTPICQILPFKRDEWHSDILEFTQNNKEKYLSKVLSKVSRSYKNQFWQKKKFN